MVLRQEHRPGEKLFLDWAGATIPIHHKDGATTAAPLFVSALGVSSYTYAEVTANQQMENWLKVQMNAFEFYGGCPQLLIPDNTKTGVSRASASRISIPPTRSSPPTITSPCCRRVRENPATRPRWKARYRWCSGGL